MHIHKNTLSLLATASLITGVFFAGQTQAQGVLFVVDDKVGVGTDTPDQEFDVEAAGPNVRLTNTGSGGGIFDFRMNANTGRFTFTDDPNGMRNPFKIGTNADNNLFKVGTTASNQVDITGNLVVTGTISPDYVFLPEYELESIEDHATMMWENRHLPAVGAGQTDHKGRGLVNVGQRSQGMLEELEKAHIYIEQLNSSLKEKDGQIADLEARLSSIESALTTQK